MQGVIADFAYTPVTVGSTRYRPGVAGSGPPVLLLHGFPQTHARWHRIAPGLAEQRTVVADRERGRRIACPVLVHWGGEEEAMSDGPLAVWQRWADEVRGGPLPSGHFLPEEAPAELLASLRAFLR